MALMPQIHQILYNNIHFNIGYRRRRELRSLLFYLVQLVQNAQRHPS